MKPNVAVLMGGKSLEREVSLHTGKRVSQALKEKGYPVTTIDVDEHLVFQLKRKKYHLAYIALHGQYGEDGTVQELLEILHIPYTGTGIYGSMIGMDKALSKEIFKREKIPTPDFYALSSGAIKEMGASAVLNRIAKKIGLPIVVKPSAQGSALGIKFVYKNEQLPTAILGALSYGDKIILEKYIEGKEIALSVLGNKNPMALPIVEIVPKKGFFDFQSMYTMGMTDYYIPARISTKLTKKIQDLSIKVFNVLQCSNVARVDIIIGKDNIPYVLEINTVPGMTETSLLPMAAENAGINFPDLVEKIVKLSLAKK